MRKLGLTLTALLLGTALAAEPKSTFTVIRPTQWGGENYNPFMPGSQHLLPTLSAIYETLFYVNTLDGKVTPVLGTKYAWSGGNKTLTVTTRSGVKWHNGSAFTANDAAFSFNLLKKFPAMDTAGVWKSGLTSVKATNPTTLVFTFSKPNTPFFVYLAHSPIVPEAIWKDIKDPLTDPNLKPVGTGPFVAEQYSQQALRVLKNPNYWIKGQPYVDAVVWMATNSNEAAQLKLLKNEGDYGFVGVSDPKQYAKSAEHYYWWPTITFNYLYFNTTKGALKDPAFRRAISMGINVKDATEKAFSGAVNPADPSGVIPSQQKTWLSAANKAAAAKLKYDPVAADKALTAAGYKKDSKGNRLDKDGKPLPTYRILVGSGWTDYITVATVAGENLKKLGIKTQVDQQAWSSYAGSFQTATYDMGVSWGWGSGPTPYYGFFAAFSPEFSAPVGKTAASNLTRYTNPVITKALETFRASSDQAVQKKAIDTIVAAVIKDAPWLPVTERTNVSLYNSSRFTGLPTAQNAYNDSTPDDQIGARLMYLNVKPK